MHLKISLDLTALNNASFSSTFYFEFENVSNIENWYDPEEDVTALEFYNGSTSKIMYVFLNGGTTPSYDQTDDLYELADVRDQPLIFECDIPESQNDRLYEFYKLGIIDIISSTNKTVVLAFRLNTDRDHVSKDLKLITIMEGSFKAPLGIKSFELDVISYDIDNSYNYVYIPRLKRYYYISTPQLVTNSYTKLILQEDVLQTWESLIKSQDAFVIRQENSYSEELFDNRRPLEDVLTVADVTSSAVDTAVSSSKKNITLDFSIPWGSSYHEDCYHILVTSFSNVRSSSNGKNPYNAPSGSGLADLTSIHNNYQWFTFVSGGNLGVLMKALINDDVSASFIQSILWLPFDPSTAISLEVGGVYAGDNYLTINETFEPLSNPVSPSLPCRWATEASGLRGVCPYLIIKDFTYSDDLVGINVEPYANYEFFIPFVGWIKVESNKFFNKRILIYYNLELTTGSATAFIYNYTDKVVIWSGTCQMGIKIDISTTNQLENTRQKQANENNMILSLLTSAVSVGIGVATENPVALVGGVLSGAKAITSYVNTNNQIFERAQTTFGSGESAMHTNIDFKIRKTYHKPISITETVFAHTQGYPSNNYTSLSSLTGYTEIGDIHFDAKGENIYNVEIDEIVALLKNGVIF